VKNIHIALDLDGTLAYYDGWKGDDHIGEPISRMVNKLYGWIEKGYKVTLFTARVSSRDLDQNAYALHHITKWFSKHDLPQLDVTSNKLKSFTHFVDDRAIAVITNTGKTIGGIM